MPTTTTVVIAISGICALAYAARLFTGTDSDTPASSITDAPPTKLEEQKITLEALSAVWAKGQIRKIPITDISKIWVSQNTPAEAVPTKEHVFTRRELAAFYRDISQQPFFKGKQIEAVAELLEELDKYGDCPSVVDKHKLESERGIATYDILKTVPLWQHSLNVVDEIIRLTPRGPLTPKAVIAALAHDIGKIPKNYDPMCTSAVHGFISGMMIEYFPALKSLRYSDEVIESVRLHHTPPDGNYLANLLQNADQAARRVEIFRNQGTAEGQDPVAPTANQEPPPPPPPRESSGNDVLGMPTSPPSTDPMGMDTAPKTKGKQVSIPWYTDELLKPVLKGQVNKPLPKERFWGALSMPDGVCYFKLNAFWECIKRAFPDASEIQAADKQMQSNIMLSISGALMAGGDIPAGVVRKDQIGAMFVMNPESEKPTDMYLIPIKTESLGLDVQACELSKPASYKNVKRLKPKFTRPTL